MGNHRSAPLGGSPPSSPAHKARRDSDINSSVLGEFVGWTMPLVEAAYRRSLACKQRINRRQFWDIFTEYSAVRRNEFMSLPLPVYDAFVEEDGLVDVLQVLSMMVLFSQGTPQVQQRFVFRMGTATTDAEYMTAPDAINIMSAVAAGAHKLGLLVEPPDESYIEDLARELVSQYGESLETVAEDVVSMKEAQVWCRTHAAPRNILSIVKAVRTHAVRVGRRMSLHPLSVQTVLQSETEGQGEERVPAAVLRECDQRITATTAVLAAIERAHDELTVEDMQQMRKAFQDVTATSKKGTLTREQFSYVLEEHFIGLSGSTGNALTRELFQAFDTDKSGDIDMGEFIVGLAQCSRGEAVDKVPLIFEACGTMNMETKQACIQAPMLRKLVERAIVRLLNVANITEEVLVSLDADGIGTVPRVELLDTLHRHPAAHDFFFARMMPPGLEYLRRPGACPTKFTISRLATVWHRKFMKRKHPLAGRMSESKFRVLLEDEFGIAPDHPLTRKLYTVAQSLAQSPEIVNVEHVMLVLVMCVTGACEDKSDLFMSIMGHAGNTDTMFFFQLQQLMVHCRLRMQSMTRSATEILHRELLDVSGGVPLPEFQRVIRDHPDLEDCIILLFSVPHRSQVGEMTKAAEISQLLLEEDNAERRLKEAFKSNDEAPSNMTIDEWRRHNASRLRGTRAITQMRRASLGTMATIVSMLQSSSEGVGGALNIATTIYKRKLAEEMRGTRRQFFGQVQHMRETVVLTHAEMAEMVSAINSSRRGSSAGSPPPTSRPSSSAPHAVGSRPASSMSASRSVSPLQSESVLTAAEHSSLFVDTGVPPETGRSITSQRSRTRSASSKSGNTTGRSRPSSSAASHRRQSRHSAALAIAAELQQAMDGSLTDGVFNESVLPEVSDETLNWLMPPQPTELPEEPSGWSSPPQPTDDTLTQTDVAFFQTAVPDEPAAATTESLPPIASTAGRSRKSTRKPRRSRSRSPPPMVLGHAASMPSLLHRSASPASTVDTEDGKRSRSPSPPRLRLPPPQPVANAGTVVFDATGSSILMPYHVYINPQYHPPVTVPLPIPKTKSWSSLMTEHQTKKAMVKQHQEKKLLEHRVELMLPGATMSMTEKPAHVGPAIPRTTRRRKGATKRRSRLVRLV